MQPFQKTNDYQIRQSLRLLTGNPECMDEYAYPGILDVFAMLYNGAQLRLPCDPYHLFVIYERFPIFNDLQQSVNKSVLLRQLFDRTDETGVVVDSVFSGKKALFLAGLVQSRQAMIDWLNFMYEFSIELNIKKIDEEHKVIIAPLYCFVHPRSEL